MADTDSGFTATRPDVDMETSQQKTVIQTPRSGDGGGPLSGRALPNGYVLQGRYVIEKQLGAGGFGITYLAKHRYLEDIWVAIKEYLPEGAAVRDESSRVHPISAQHDKIYNWGLHRFLDEARLLRQFQHPNIVAVEDFFEANDTAYLVMNYIRGRSIQADLDNGREFSEGDLRIIIYQLLNALNCIHRDGLYHRDISPDNIQLREDDDSPVLIDFGSARYEMRMLGAEQGDDEQGHTPTTIFKSGYSPVEQYEGTTQGPYTDIYALAATLYRIAFGVRPIDALKRSGERRLTHKDPLIPAKERGKGQFSEDFLDTIDVALQIDPGDRPQTIDKWLEHLKNHPEMAPPKPAPQRAAPHGRRWPGLMLAALLGGIAAGGFYLWQSQLEPPQPDPGDIPGTLAAANRMFAAAPFDPDRQTKAGALYRRVLDLDGFNDRALAGLSAARLLQDFEQALAVEDRTEAVVLLGDIEKEFREAGIGVDTLDNGWQRLERIRKQYTLREMLPRDPLSPQTWEQATNLLDEIRQLPGGTSMAHRGTRALTALRATDAALQREEFSVSREQLAQAVNELSELGIEDLPAATALIDERERLFETRRRARITELMQSAERDLAAEPLLRKSVEQAAGRIEEILTLDEGHSEAQARSRLLETMLQAYTQIGNDSFDPARETLASAEKIARNAGFDTGPLGRANAYLAEREQVWKTAQTRNALRERLSEATDLLSTTPLAPTALEHARKLYQESLKMSSNTVVFGAENSTATQGAGLTDLLAKINLSLERAAFATARTDLANPKNEALARGIGLGPAVLRRVAQAIDQRELNWQRAAALALLNGATPLADETLAATRIHVARMLELASDDAEARQLSQGLKRYEAFDEARQRNDYPAAIPLLQQAIEAFTAAGADNPRFQAAYAQVQDAAAAWDTRQRESRIATLLQQAFGMLRQAPLSAEVQAAVGRVFNAVANIQGNKGRSAQGNQLLADLRSVNEALEQARFEQASQALDQADAVLAAFGEAPLNKTRLALQKKQQTWLDMLAKQHGEHIADATAMLREGPLDSGLLARLRDTFQALGGLHQGAKTASAGLALVGQLEQALDAIRRNAYPQANAWLDKAEAQLPAVGLDSDLLLAIRNDTAEAALQFSVGRASGEIAALLNDAMALIRQSPLDDPSLQLASDALSKAVELNESLPEPRSQASRITAGLETVFMLRAFAAELRDRQFDAMRQTVTDLNELLPAAGLDAGLADELQQIALRAEADWRIAKLREFMQKGSWRQSRDLSPALKQLKAIDALSTEHPQTEPWRQALTDLQQMFTLRAQRQFGKALQSLAAAQATLKQLGMENGELGTLRERIVGEQQRWRNLSEERDLITWTGQAVATLDRKPFEPDAWQQVEGLTTRILEVRADDERGLVLRDALAAVRQASQALAAGDFPQAVEQVQQAQKKLTTIGLESALTSALADIEAQMHRSHASQLQAVTSLLDSGVIDDARLAQAQAKLQEVLQRTPQQPTATTASEVLAAIIEARQATAATRYAEAAKTLAQAGERLNGDVVSNVDPLPALRVVLQGTRQWLAARRPSPAEIYPIISVGLRKISQKPLDITQLEAAETLLRNALGLQSDEPSALGGIATIGYLRDTRHAIDNGDAAAARQALQQAESSLESIGLAPSMLQAARDEVDAVSP